jgi:hypothetical protein
MLQSKTCVSKRATRIRSTQSKASTVCSKCEAPLLTRLGLPLKGAGVLFETKAFDRCEAAREAMLWAIIVPTALKDPSE